MDDIKDMFEDMMNDDTTLLIFAAALLIFSLFFLFAKIKHKQLLDEDSGMRDLKSDFPIRSRKATVLSKIEPENPNGIFFGLAHVIFETEEKERIKVAVKDKGIYDYILVGDVGVLETKGSAFVRFRRAL